MKTFSEWLTESDSDHYTNIKKKLRDAAFSIKNLKPKGNKNAEYISQYSAAAQTAAEAFASVALKIQYNSRRNASMCADLEKLLTISAKATKEISHKEAFYDSISIVSPFREMFEKLADEEDRRIAVNKAAASKAAAQSAKEFPIRLAKAKKEAEERAKYRKNTPHNSVSVHRDSGPGFGYKLKFVLRVSNPVSGTGDLVRAPFSVQKDLPRTLTSAGRYPNLYFDTEAVAIEYAKKNGWKVE